MRCFLKRLTFAILRFRIMNFKPSGRVRNDSERKSRLRKAIFLRKNTARISRSCRRTFQILVKQRYSPERKVKSLSTPTLRTTWPIAGRIGRNPSKKRSVSARTFWTSSLKKQRPYLIKRQNFSLSPECLKI